MFFKTNQDPNKTTELFYVYKHQLTLATRKNVSLHIHTYAEKVCNKCTENMWEIYWKVTKTWTTSQISITFSNFCTLVRNIFQTLKLFCMLINFINPFGQWYHTETNQFTAFLYNANWALNLLKNKYTSDSCKILTKNELTSSITSCYTLI